ncbi:MAG: hypothetical protein ACC652_01560, partial [Acidimicrobiales bacterium]
PSTSTVPDEVSTTAVPPTTVVEAPQVGTVAVLVESYLVLVDVETGETLYSKRLNDGGMFADNISLSPDATTAYYDVSWEDSWYNCETSVGEVNSLVLDGAGEPTSLVPGADWTFALTTDFAAYVTSNRCIPDPEQPDDWVIVFFDTIELVDLVTLIE